MLSVYFFLYVKLFLFFYENKANLLYLKAKLLKLTMCTFKANIYANAECVFLFICEVIFFFYEKKRIYFIWKPSYWSYFKVNHDQYRHDFLVTWLTNTTRRQMSKVMVLWFIYSPNGTNIMNYKIMSRYHGALNTTHRLTGWLMCNELYIYRYIYSMYICVCYLHWFALVFKVVSWIIIEQCERERVVRDR